MCGYIGFRVEGFQKNRGTCLGGPYNSFLGSILGSPSSSKLPFGILELGCRAQDFRLYVAGV